MTDISCGGGPSLEQRRKFAGLKPGGHVPGYMGYSPQLKYRVGQTYGLDTAELAKERHHRLPSAPIPLVSGRQPLQNELPKSIGDNKYTENMVPGYTGYVPRYTFKFGGTYKNDCDISIDEHLTNLKRYEKKEYDLMRSKQAFPTLKPVAFDPQVRDHLNTFGDQLPGKRMTDKRGSLEPPIPGYIGYVPRVYTTEVGLGCRYHQMTRNGLETFRAEQDHHKAVQREPINIHRYPGAVSAPAAPTYNKRIYEQSGMIPRYTGYVPERRFAFGDNYGNTTRSLEVCAHDKSCYGEHMRTRPKSIYASLA